MNRISAKTALTYSIGSLAAGIYYAFNNFTLPLYLSHFTSNAIVIGWLSSTRSGEQAIVQPLVGAWSDRTWTRLGRRAPFFLLAMPASALLLVLNGVLPLDPSFFLIVVATVFIFSFLFNIGIDPYVALLADVTPSEQRGTVNGIANVLGLAGQIALLVIAAILLAGHSPYIFFFVAACLVIGFGIVALGVRERKEQIHAEGKVAKPSLAGWSRYAVDRWREQREAVKLLAVKFMYQIGINAASPFLTLFVVTEIGTRGWPDLVQSLPFLASSGLDRMDAQGLSQIVAAFFLLIMVLAALPCGLLGDRFGKKMILSIGLVVTGVFALIAAFAATIPQLLFYLVFIGIGNAAVSVLFFPYLSDLVPADKIGEFQGLSATSETGGVAISVLIAGILINLNLFGSQYRPIFIITGVFLLLGAIGVLFVKAKLSATIAQAPAEAIPAVSAS